MRVPILSILLIIFCACYSISIVIGISVSFARNHNDHNLISGCLKSCYNYDHDINTTSCYADIYSSISTCALDGLPVLIIILLFVAFILVISNSIIGCVLCWKDGECCGNEFISYHYDEQYCLLISRI